MAPAENFECTDGDDEEPLRQTIEGTTEDDPVKTEEEKVEAEPNGKEGSDSDEEDYDDYLNRLE